MKLSPRRQILLALLALALLGLQARLWIGEGSLRHVAALEEELQALEKENQRLRKRNALIAADVENLKSGLEAVEEIARKDLGMVREGETFFLIVDERDGEADHDPAE